MQLTFCSVACVVIYRCCDYRWEMSFFRRHLLPGIGLLLGPAIAIGSLIMHAYALTEMGLPVEVWVAIGLSIFFMSVIGILYQQHAGAGRAQMMCSMGPEHAYLTSGQLLRSKSQGCCGSRRGKSERVSV